jgi:hypothetical protein
MDKAIHTHIEYVLLPHVINKQLNIAQKDFVILCLVQLDQPVDPLLRAYGCVDHES